MGERSNHDRSPPTCKHAALRTTALTSPARTPQEPGAQDGVGHPHRRRQALVVIPPLPRRDEPRGVDQAEGDELVEADEGGAPPGPRVQGVGDEARPDALQRDEAARRRRMSVGVDGTRVDVEAVREGEQAKGALRGPQRTQWVIGGAQPQVLRHTPIFSVIFSLSADSARGTRRRTPPGRRPAAGCSASGRASATAAAAAARCRAAAGSAVRRS